jgi:subtilase family serine protease
MNQDYLLLSEIEKNRKLKISSSNIGNFTRRKHEKFKTSVICCCKNFYVFMSIFFVFCFTNVNILNATGRQVIMGQIPKDEARSTKIDRLPPDQKLKLLVILPFQNQSSYESYVKKTIDPSSPLYGQNLTPERLKKEFGQSDQDLQTVIDYFKSKNLLVSRNRLEIDVTVSGRVIDIEKVFHVRLYNYRLPEGKMFYAPDNEPFIDLDVPVLHVQGLDNDAPPVSSHSKAVNYEN